MAEKPNNIVNLFIPCNMDMFQPSIAKSTMAVLERIGLRYIYHDEQTCCGRRFYMEGEIVYAKDLGDKLLTEYDVNLPFIVPDCACAGYMKKYFRTLLENTHIPNDLKSFTQHVYELCDYLVYVKQLQNLGNKFSHRVFYFKSCASRNLYPQSDAPEILLSNTEGLELLTDDTIQGCCGANGRFSMANPSAAETLTGDIVKRIYDMGAQYVTSTDIHCLQQLDAFIADHDTGLDVIHIADILNGE
mgnify:CR=1 FL=1